MDWEPARVKHFEAVERLFPELRPHGVRMDQGAPGRYWPAEEAPPMLTAFDKKIVALAGGEIRKKKLRSPKILTEAGVAPVAYAARIYALIAWNNANFDVRHLSRESAKTLDVERHALKLRISSSRTIVEECSSNLIIPAGNPYLEPFDPIQIEADRESGRALHGALTAEMERDTRRLSIVEKEISRISSFKDIAVWQTSFFLLMGNLWTCITGELPAINRGPFTDLLDAAVRTIGGRNDGDETFAWGVADNLRKKFNDAVPGEGFYLGQTGELSLDSIHQIRSRGPDMVTFLDVASGDLGAMIAMAVALRDYSEAPEEVLLRELVLRPRFKAGGILPPIIRAQIGWLYEMSPKVIISAARRAIAAGRGGDARSAAAVEIAARAQSLAISREAGWGMRYDITWPAEQFCGLNRSTVRHGLQRQVIERDDLLSAALLDWPGL